MYLTEHSCRIEAYRRCVTNDTASDNDQGTELFTQLLRHLGEDLFNTSRLGRDVDMHFHHLGAGKIARESLCRVHSPDLQNIQARKRRDGRETCHRIGTVLSAQEAYIAFLRILSEHTSFIGLSSSLFGMSLGMSEGRSLSSRRIEVHYGH